MQITQNNNKSQQFGGSFLINYKKAILGMREAFESAVGKPKVQVFDSFNGKENQVMYVMKNSKDYDAATFIQKNELNFKYYPEVSTKLQFELDKPQDIVAYIKSTKPKLIQKHHELAEFISKCRENCRQVKDSHLSLVDKILGSLHIDKNSGEKIKKSNAVTIFTDKETGKKVFVSPKNHHGTSFVLVNPNNSYEDVSRYAFDDRGNLLRSFEPPNGLKIFMEKFNEAIKHQSNPVKK